MGKRRIRVSKRHSHLVGAKDLGPWPHSDPQPEPEDCYPNLLSMGDMALRPIRQQAITRVLPLLLVTIALASNTNLFAMSGSQRNTATPSPPPFATANATATGTALVMWGDPYLPVQISDGNGTLT